MAQSKRKPAKPAAKRVRKPKLAECPVCGGSGLNNEDRSQLCDNCEGAGQVKA